MTNQSYTIVIDDDEIFTENIVDSLDIDEISCMTYNCPEKFLSSMADIINDNCLCVVVDFNLNHQLTGVNVIEEIYKVISLKDLRTQIILYSGNINHLPEKKDENFLDTIGALKIEKPAFEELTNKIKELFKGFI